MQSTLIPHMPTNYRRDIDGLRSFAILPVILFHAGANWMPGGFVGVDIFFVISGYLISSIIFREVEAGNFSFLKFYERRLRRIIPALLVMLLVTLMVFQIIALPDQSQMTAESAIAAFFSVSNIYFWQESGYFAPAVEYMPLLHTWSLGVEEQFYLIFPVLILFIWRLNISMSLALLVMIVMAFAVAYWLASIKPSAAFYLLPARAWELGIGALIACRVIPALREGIVRELATVGGLALIVFSLFWIRSDMMFPGWVALLPCIGTALILHADGTSWVSRNILGNSALVFVGLISYSLYLWHWPVMAAFRILGASIHMEAMTALLSVVLTFLVACLSWQIVEKPFRDRKEMSNRRMLTSIGALSLFTLGLSTFSIVKEGFPSRLGEDATHALAAAQDIDPYREPCRDRSLERNCRFGSAIGPLTTVIVGDSHAAAIRGGIEGAGLLAEGGATMIWEGACPLLLGVDPTNHDERQRCLDFKAYAWEQLEALPDVKTVILGGRWPYQMTGYLPESGGSYRALFADEETTTLSEEENERVFTRALDRTLDRLLAMGFRVIVVGSVPEAGFDVPRTIALRRYHQTSVPTGIPRDFVQSRAGKADALIDRVASARQDVTFLSIWEGFCSDTTCKIEQDGKPLFYDGSHLSYYAAKRIAAPLLAAGNQRNNYQ